MILLTGATGFIGKHLLEGLIREYGSAQVIALTSKPVENCPYLLHHDYTFDRNYFVQSGYSDIDTIIHAGAFTPKSASRANDWRACNSNIQSTDKLLNAELPNLEKIVYLSTIDVYGVANIISEESIVCPLSLYGYSKVYCEGMVSSMAAEKNMVCQLLRVGHVYGPGEEAYQKIIPATIKKLLKGGPVEVWGSGESMRSFIYIGDIVTSILRAVRLKNNQGLVNLVSDHAITIRNLVEKVIKISHTAAQIQTIPSDFPQRNMVFNNDKMRRLLLDKETRLDDGLQVEWDYMKLLGA